MKLIFCISLVLTIFFNTSCSTNQKKENSESNSAENKAEVVPKVESVTANAPAVEENVNLDIALQENLKNLWKQYFVEDFNDSRSVDVLVFTNRAFKGKAFGCTDDHFGVTGDANFRVGVCRINVPRNHSTGELKVTRNQRESSHDYFKIIGQKELNFNFLLNHLKKAKRSPLVFVHGFNVKHEEAILRASQIAYDLKFQGPIILFSWPAGAGEGFFGDKFINKTYEENLKNAKSTISTFKIFISKLIENKIKPNIVVHSMGHQVILPALFEIAKDWQASTEADLPIGELILNAPDFDAELFVNNVDLIKAMSKRITLYCSYNDKAMVASETVNNSKRLGACAYVEGVDTINVSLLDNPTFGLGHGYYSSRSILTDVFQVLLGLEADRRLFIRKSDPNSTEKYYLRQ